MGQFIVTKRLRDLPNEYVIPGRCEYCGIRKDYDRASSFVWATATATATDGTKVNTHGFCCMRCARLWIDKQAQEGV